MRWLIDVCKRIGLKMNRNKSKVRVFGEKEGSVCVYVKSL